MQGIKMVDLKGQYDRLSKEINHAIQEVIDGTAFINGPSVGAFRDELAAFLEVPFVVPCGNGTDALQVALMALRRPLRVTGIAAVDFLVLWGGLVVALVGSGLVDSSFEAGDALFFYGE